MAEIITVIAPRHQRWDPLDPGSRIAFRDFDPRHPANPTYNYQAGEVCIDEGDGVPGDPAGRETPWQIARTPWVEGALTRGALKVITTQAEAEAGALPDDAIATLECLTPAQATALGKRAENLDGLVEKLEQAPDPVKWLSGAKGIGRATAEQVLVELEARGLWG